MTTNSADRRQLRAVWEIRQYRRLMYSRLVSNIGNGITPVALSFGVLELDGASGRSLSIVNGSLMLSVALFMLVGGVVADRFGRCRVVGTSDVLGSLVVAASAALLVSGRATVPLLAFNAFVLGALNAVWLPAYRGVIPQIVPAHLLQSANSLNGVFANVFMVVGSASAGLVVAIVGAGWAVMLDAVSFLIAGVLVLSLRSTDVLREGAGRVSALGQLREGWQEFVGRRWMVGNAVGTALFFFAFQAFLSVIGPVQMKRAMGGARDWGFALAGWGIGGLIGVLLAARLHPRRPLFAGWSVMALNVGWMLAVAAALPIPWVVLGAVLSGASGDFNFILGVTVTQTHVPEEVLSRVTSYSELAMAVFAPLGLAVAGPLVDIHGASTMAMVASTVTLVAVMIPLAFGSVRRLERV